MSISLASARRVQLLQPPRIGFGIGSADDCTEFLKRFTCEHILVLASGSVLPSAQSFLDQLREIATTITVRTDIPPEPDVALVETIRSETRELPLDAVVGLGGGSVLDVAKLVAALHGHSEPVQAFFGKDLLPERRVRLVCLPTTAGAGSEVSPNAILYDKVDQTKKAAISPSLIPDAAFVDPAFARTLPPATTAATGFDAMCHCIEAYANRNAHPVVDHYALEGVRLIARHLATAVQDGDDLGARSAIALGSLYGGLCLGPVNTAAVHALSYPLGSRFRLPHGLANALLMPHVLRFNLPAAPDRYADVARALGAADEGSAAEVAEAGIERLLDLARECDLELSLERHGITEDDLESLAEEALKITRLLDNNPRELTVEDARSIYAQALKS